MIDRFCRWATALIIGLAFLGVMASSAAWAGVPERLTQQGRLFGNDGAPLNNSVTMTFSIYADPAGGAPLWSETRTVTLDQGYFSVDLGSVTPFPTSLWDGSAHYVGLQVGSDPEMTPRQSTASVPYALVSRDAVGDIHPSTVSVQGSMVIDANGNWVGPSSGLVGSPGSAGPTGPQGPAGQDGAPGPQGNMGPEGPPGQSVIGMSLSPGDPVCPHGGSKLTVQGADTYACNGAPGPQGAAGLMGPAGPAGVGGASVLDTAGVSAGATTVTVYATVSPALGGRAWLAIEPYTTACEVIPIASVAPQANGSVVGLARPVTAAHAAQAGAVVLSDGTLTPQLFGASGDDAVDDTDAIQAAINAKDTLGGGIVFFQAGTYRISDTMNLGRAIHLGSAPVTLRGVGWETRVAAPFNNLAWSICDGNPSICPSEFHNHPVTGSVIVATGPGDAFQAGVPGTYFSGLVMEDLAIIGPGLPSSAGFRMDPTADPSPTIQRSLLGSRFRNLLFANFFEGIAVNTEDCSFEAITVLGCDTGILVTRSTTDTRFYDVTGSRCANAIRIDNGGGIFFYGGVLQSNWNALVIAPGPGANLDSIHFSGLWLEANQDAESVTAGGKAYADASHITFDTSNYDHATYTGLMATLSFTGLHVTSPRCDDTDPQCLNPHYDTIKFITTSQSNDNTTISLSFTSNDMTGVDMQVPFFVSNFVSVNNRFYNFGAPLYPPFCFPPSCLQAVGVQQIGDRVTQVNLLDTNFNGVTGISGSTKSANNLRGKIDMGGTDSARPVVFVRPEPDDDYRVLLTGSYKYDSNHPNIGPPTNPDAYVLHVEDQTTTGFIVKAKGPPGNGTSLDINWMIVR